ncbi:ImpA family type VI secretion-associated protein [Burkholderia pseudomallei]|nr:ImpA family type VI secretion-associated protein [Burkholderia pseudomallei]
MELRSSRRHGFSASSIIARKPGSAITQLLVFVLLLLSLIGASHAQNYNAMSTYPVNKLQWDEPAARAYEETSLANAWSTGFAKSGSTEQCRLGSWYVHPGFTTYNPPMHTRAMTSDATCWDPASSGAPWTYTRYATYYVYTCDAGYHWGVQAAYPSVLDCQTGYYPSPLGDNASNGHCDCPGGRPATPYPIEIGTGNMSESATDFVSGEGRLRLDRYYNSNPLNPASGGMGWKNAYLARHIGRIEDSIPTPALSGNTATPSTASVIYTSASDACTKGVANMAAIYPSYAGMTATYSNGQCLLSNGKAMPIFHTSSTLAYSNAVTDAVTGVTVFRPDGSQYTFTCANGTCAAQGQSELSLSASSSGYTLTAENGDVERYDLNGNLQTIVSRDGYTQTISSSTDATTGRTTISAVSDSYGRTLTFAYDSYGRLNQVTLPDQATVQYAYDTASRLSGVTYPDKSVVGYQYGNANFPQALTAWIDEAKATYATWSYDNTSGKAITSALAGNVDTSSLSYVSNSTTLTDNLGTSRTYTYQDIAGALRVTAISGPMCKDCLGQSMSYDGNGFLASTLDWNGNTTQYIYGSTGLLQQRMDGVGSPAQRSTAQTWNTALRVPLTRTVSNAGGTVVSNEQWVYNTAGQTLARCEIDPTNSAASGYSCSNTGTVPAGVRRWTYTYCTAVDTTQCPIVGLPLTATGPRTDLTQTQAYSYYLSSSATSCGTPGAACYQAGDLKSVTDALGHVITMASYDAAGRVTRMIDSNGTFTDLTYTPRGWLASRTVNGAVTKFTYTPYGLVASITDPDGIATSYTYDAAHRLTRITDALGNYLQYTLDAAGNVTQEQTFDSSGTLHKSLTRTFNTLGQLTQVVDGLNHTVFNASPSGSYDANGNLVQSADALGIQHKLGYDALNRLVQTIDNYNGGDIATANTTTTTSLDALDRVTQITDPSNLSTTYPFDGLSNAIGQTSPDSGTTTRTFDAAGNVLTRTDAKGITATHTYDALNRPLTVSYADVTQAIAYYYYYYDEPNSSTHCTSSAPIGRLTRVVENAVTTVYCYDAWGHVIQKQQITSAGTDTVGYSYTAAGRLSGIVYPSATLVSYSRDGDGRIQSLSVTPANGTTSTAVSGVTYLPFGPITGYTLGNGQAITRTYDANYRLTDLTSPAFTLHLARDALGEITAIGNAPGANPASETYSYDPLQRLTAITEANGSVLESVTYNPTGDRLSKTGSGLATGSYSYNPGTHQLIATGSAARTVDANGNTMAITQAGTTYGFGYNPRNRLSVVQQNQATVATYTYNANNERIAKTINGASERYAYNEGSQMLGEYGAMNRDYIWLDGIPVANVDGQGTSSTIAYVTADQLGTPRAITNASGTTVWQWAYAGNAWGEVAPTSNGYTYNLRFPGQYADAESGVSDNLHRTFDPNVGGYLQVDPLGYAGGQASLYAYVGENPMSDVDPDGLRVKVADSLRKAYDRIRKTKRGGQLCKALEGSPKLYNVDTTSNGPLKNNPDPNIRNAPAYSDKISNVYVDPDAHPLMNTSEGYTPASTEDLLAHELGHIATGVEDSGIGRMDNINQNENPVRQELGEPRRVTYDMVL